MQVTIHFDGAAEPNPGIASWGYTLHFSGGKWDGAKHSDCGVLAQRNTNNVAEYTALGKALRALIDAKNLPVSDDPPDENTPRLTKEAGGPTGLPRVGQGDSLLMRGDSKLVVCQIDGSWRCNAENLIPLRDRCRELLAQLECSWSIEWIPRAQNADADALSVAAWCEFTKKPFPVRVRKK